MKIMRASTSAAFLQKDAGAPVPERQRWQRSSAAPAGPRAAASVHLSPRQLEVLGLLCEGLPNKLICRQLNIAAGTVKVHISLILRELGVANRLQAVVAAQRSGLIGDTGCPSDPPTGSAPADGPAMIGNASECGTARRLVAA